MKKLLFPIVLLVVLFSAYRPKSLQGTWQYSGGVYNGKREDGTNDYTLQRKYDDTHFEAYLIEPKQQPFKYQSGSYTLQNDTCSETETFSAQPSKLTGITINYHYRIHRDSLILSGVLPNGKQVEEYWKRIKQ